MPMIDEIDNIIVRIDPRMMPLQAIIGKDFKNNTNSSSDTVLPFCIKLNLLGLFVSRKTLRPFNVNIFSIHLDT